MAGLRSALGYPDGLWARSCQGLSEPVERKNDIPPAWHVPVFIQHPPHARQQHADGLRSGSLWGDAPFPVKHHRCQNTASAGAVLRPAELLPASCLFPCAGSLLQYLPYTRKFSVRRKPVRYSLSGSERDRRLVRILLPSIP